MMKKLGGVLTAALIFGAAHSAFAVERGHTLVYGRYADSLILDPVLTEQNVDIWVLSNLYDTLILPTDDGQGLQPGLATKWTISPDGKTVNLTLRDGIKFSNGRAITPADVVWSLNRANDPKNGIWGFLISSIASVAVNGTNGVTITLQHPDPAFLRALSVFNTAILPEKEFEAEPGATDADKSRVFFTTPVTSGAFEFKSWQRDSEMVLTRNPYYWSKGADGKPLPYLDEIDFKIVPDDATRILQLESGALDGAEFIPYARVDELKSKPDLNMKLFLSTRVEYVLTNTHDMVLGQKNPLENLDVRHALQYATNINALIQIVTHGVGSPMTSFMSKATPYHSGKTLFPYDLAKAKALLTKTGYPQGFTTTMLVLAGNQDELSTATILQQMWSQIGVTLKLQQVDSATRTAAYHAGKFDMRLSAWTDDIADPSEITSYFAYSPTTDSQHTGWKNDAINTLFEASQSELDPVKRRADYAEIQKVYNETGPILPLYETPYPVALRKDVHGFNQIPLGNNIFRGTWVSK